MRSPQTDLSRSWRERSARHVLPLMRAALVHPGRIVPLLYAAGWMIGTLALALPWASHAHAGVGLWQAGFTSMSALCITGLAVVDTPTAWTPFGQVVIMLLIQVGGFGIMTLTSMVMFSLFGSGSAKAARVAVTETRVDHRDIAAIPWRILRLSVACECVLAAWLALRWSATGMSLARASYYGVFHAISAFNNAGFALYSDSLMSQAADGWIMVPICCGVVAGGIGFPVYLELFDRLRRRRTRTIASVHLRLTLLGTVVLLAVGALPFIFFEWTNPATLGHATWGEKILGAFAGAVFPRTAGFNAIDYAHATEPTILINDVLMMIGGGSASTAGGLKITTVAVLAVAVMSELVGEPDSVVAARRLSSTAIRQALAVTVVATGAVIAGIVAISVPDAANLEKLSFEAVSAFSNTGLSMGLTPTLSHFSWAVLMILMFLGRVGPVSAVAALTMHGRLRRFTYPQEDPLIG